MREPGGEYLAALSSREYRTCEMALASGGHLSLRLQGTRIRLLQGALECVGEGLIPGGLKANRDFAECMVEYESGIPEDLKTILFDPQTAGGLLIAVSASVAGQLVQALAEAGVPAIEIGEVLEAEKPSIHVGF